MFIHSMDYNKYLYIYIYEKIANKKDDGKGESLYIYSSIGAYNASSI